MRFTNWQTIFSVSIAIVALTGCVQMAPLQTGGVIVPTVEQRDRCAGLNDVPDAELASRLDMASVVLHKIRTATGRSNEQICRLTIADIDKVMLADRNRYRNPDRKTFRAPAKDFMRQWDADDQGNLPSSTQILTAESARKSIMGGTRRSGEVGVPAVGQAAGISSARWTALGPGNVGGRIRAITIDPRNQNRVFVGAASGGIWLSENAGQSFVPVADFIGNLAISALTFDPSNPNVMYAGTGESFTGLTGIGMFKSTDGGATWSFLANTTTDTAVNSLGSEWGFVNRIVVNPVNSNLILAATTRLTNLTQGAIMRSIDGGNSWTRIQLAVGTVVTTNPPHALDLKIDPNNPNNMLAGTENGHVYYSRDAGATWIQGAALVTVARGRSGTAQISYADRLAAK